MWFLGAGASVSAGVPTAWDMIWQFKQILYAAQRRVPLSTIADTGNPSVRALLDAHVSGSGSLPPPGAPEEYAALFEAAYPAEKDRRTFIDGMMALLDGLPAIRGDKGDNRPATVEQLGPALCYH